MSLRYKKLRCKFCGDGYFIPDIYTRVCDISLIFNFLFLSVLTQLY